MEFNILKCLYDGGCTDQYHSMTITEVLNDTENLLGTRMTIYKKLRKLIKMGYIKKGIIDDHADTFYLLNKAKKLFERAAPVVPIYLIKNKGSISYDNNSVRNKLIEIMGRGLLLKSIAVNAGLSESELSRFKNGVDSLKEPDVKLLAEYLNEVNIPIWNNKETEKKMSARERLLASRNGNVEKKKSTRDWLFM